jgi:hypothetical protein
MNNRSVYVKRLPAVPLIAIAAAAFSLAEPAASPLGNIVANGNVTISNVAAPTGTTIFSGDKVTSAQLALVKFYGGSRIEMTKSTATFSRNGKTIIVQTNGGLLRFYFIKREIVQANA